MRILTTVGLALGVAFTTTPAAHTYNPPAPHRAPEVTHELVVIFFGISGTDGSPSFQKTIRDMKQSLAVATHLQQMNLVTRGVSLDTDVEEGRRDLATLGAFDEVSLGGNWTNSSVVRYLGPTMSTGNPKGGIPQVVVLEREVTRDGASSMSIGPERELARFIGMADIPAWVTAGTPLPKR